MRLHNPFEKPEVTLTLNNEEANAIIDLLDTAKRSRRGRMNYYGGKDGGNSSNHPEMDAGEAKTMRDLYQRLLDKFFSA